MMTFERIKHYLDNTQKLNTGKLVKIKEFLLKCNTAYYTEEEPILSDSEFDILSSTYRKTLERFQVSSDKLLKFSTGISDTAKIKHKVKDFLGTLTKSNNFKEVQDWVYKIVKETEIDEFDFLVSFKYDGNSVAITYDPEGNVTSATTRGKNGLGENVMQVFQNHKINNVFEKDLAVKYEVITTDEQYTALMNQKDIRYANNRSVVAGILHRKDGEDFFQFLSLVPLEVRPCAGKELSRKKQLQLIDALISANGKPLFPFKYTVFEKHPDEELRDLKGQLKNIEDIYDNLNSSARTEMTNFMFDGLVIEIMDADIRTDLGYQDGTPLFSTALKFQYLESPTKVVGVRFDYGRSGRITPVIQYEPIKFFGNVQQFTSVSNKKRFLDLNLKVGDEILVQFRNDVLSYVSMVLKRASGKPIPFTEHCPICNSTLEESETGVFANCVNPTCPGLLIGKIEQYCMNMGMKGIRFQTLEKLYLAEVITTIEDLYKDADTLMEEISEVDGFTEVSAKNFVNNIQNNREKMDYEVLGSLLIPGINVKRAKLLCEHFTIKDIINKVQNHPKEFAKDIEKIEGFADKLSEGFVISLQEGNLDTLKFLQDTLKISNYKSKVVKNDNALAFVITGDLSVPRDSFVNLLETNGHRVVSGISKKVDYLITNSPHSGTVKLKKARELGIAIITEETARKLLNT
jgi:DNA ligase (NAD+)